MEAVASLRRSSQDADQSGHQQDEFDAFGR